MKTVLYVEFGGFGIVVVVVEHVVGAGVVGLGHGRYSFSFLLVLVLLVSVLLVLVSVFLESWTTSPDGATVSGEAGSGASLLAICVAFDLSLVLALDVPSLKAFTNAW